MIFAQNRYPLLRIGVSQLDKGTQQLDIHSINDLFLSKNPFCETIFA
jgi:hypothetical protein